MNTIYTEQFALLIELSFLQFPQTALTFGWEIISIEMALNMYAGFVKHIYLASL